MVSSSPDTYNATQTGLSPDLTQAVTVEKLVYEGWGLARHPDGPVIFIPHAAPGDVVTLKPAYKSTKRSFFAEIDTIVSPSSHRIPPPCEHAGTCGGCQWQHLDAPSQAEWKQRILDETFQRQAKIAAPPMKPFVEAQQPLQYRNHVTWHVAANPLKDSASLGFQAARSHHVVSAQNCQLVPDFINELYLSLETDLGSVSPDKRPQRIDCRWNEAGEMLLLWQNNAPVEGIRSLLKPLIAGLCEKHPTLLGFILDDGESLHTLYGNAFIETRVENIPFRITAGAFFQSNPSLLPKLIEAVMAATFSSSQADSLRLLDVYAGGGLFSRFAAEKGAQVTAIESMETAIDDFEINLESIPQEVTCIEGEAEDILPKLNMPFDVAIVDPPRAGCKPAVLEALSSHISQRLIYVSCDPTTLARDTRILLDSGKWTLHSLQGFEMFPQTYHIETVAVFERISENG